MTTFSNGRLNLRRGDCLEIMDSLAPNSIDACVTDPPYHLLSTVKRFGAANAAPARQGLDGLFARASRGFMGKEWDGGDIAFRAETWAKVLRVLKPGGYLVAFSAPKCQHRMVCAIEDAGFEIRDGIRDFYSAKMRETAFYDSLSLVQKDALFALLDQGGAPVELQWAFGTGFPKSHAIEGFEGFGTALKPAYEPICLARKPLDGTNAQNVLKWGVGALNIDGCRVGGEPSPSAAMRASRPPPSSCKPGEYGDGHAIQNRISPERWSEARAGEALGRWPANLCHDGSDEVVSGFPDSGGSGPARTLKRGARDGESGWAMADAPGELRDAGNGSAARYFYSAKASKHDRAGSKHPTVKPVNLMRWLCRLVTPPGGLILDPFAGSGTTGAAAHLEGFRAILCEREAEYQTDIVNRLRELCGEDASPDLFAEEPVPTATPDLFEGLGL